MRRRRSERCGALALAGLLIAAPVAGAQQGSEGALFLLLPVGARSVGMGQAVSADRPGTEAVWWNPAALARLDKREVAIHHSQSVIGTGDAVALALPSQLLGVLTASINMTNFGETDATDPEQGTTGKILLRSFVYAATYATPIGDRLNAGITYKVLQFRVDCTGSCGPTGNLSASSSALDAGLQYDLGAYFPATIAVAVRNIGPRLQVNDRDQADALPQRLQIGISYRVPSMDRYARDTELRVAGDVIGDVRLGSTAARLGADLTWRKTVHLRGGYAFDDSETGGPSAGIGFALGGLVVDIARLFEGFSADAGQAPTYLSLRYLF